MSRRNDIDIRAGVEGVEKTKRDLKGIGSTARGMGRDVKKGAEAGHAPLKKTGGILATLKTQLGGFVSSFIGVTALISSVSRAVQSELQSLATAAENASKVMKSMRDTLFMGTFHKEHPDAYREVQQIAIDAALPGVGGQVEVAEAWKSLQSKTASFSDPQRMELLRAAGRYKRTSSTDLTTIINNMLQVPKTDPGATGKAIGNLMLQTNTEAGASAEDVALYLPELLPIGKSAGLETSQTAALLAVTTAATGGRASKAAIGVQRILMRLLGREGTPEAEATKRKLGLKRGMPIMSQLGTLHQSAPSLAQLQDVFGEEHAATASALLSNYPALQQSYANIKDAYTNPAKDIVGEKLADVFVPGSLEYIEEEARRENAKRQALIFNEDAREGLQLKGWEDRRYRELRTSGYSNTGAKARVWAEKYGSYVTTGMSGLGGMPSDNSHPWESFGEASPSTVTNDPNTVVSVNDNSVHVQYILDKKQPPGQIESRNMPYSE